MASGNESAAPLNLAVEECDDGVDDFSLPFLEILTLKEVLLLISSVV